MDDVKPLNTCPHCLSPDIRTLAGIEDEDFISFRCEACQRTFHYATVEARAAATASASPPRNSPDRRHATGVVPGAGPSTVLGAGQPVVASSGPFARSASGAPVAADDDEEESVIVLNVEDFEPARFLRSKVLRGAGFGIVEAATASEALLAVSEQVPAVALVDVNLPDADGFFVCETLKRTHPELPVLLVSAVHVSASAAHRGQRTGADGFLREPLPPDVLVQRVADALEGIRDEPSLNWVVTDSAGLVLEASAEGAQTLGIGPAHLRGRSLLTFFDGERAEWSRALLFAHAGTTLERSGRLRPRDRKPVVVEATISQAVDYPRAGSVLWTFRVLARSA